MKYATWKLNFTDPSYGTGPEPAILAQGGNAHGVFASSDVTEGGKILGYFTGEPSGLNSWNFTEITQQQALEFVLAIDDTAFVNTEGKIVTVRQDGQP